MIPRLKADLRFADLRAIWPSGSKQKNVKRFETAFGKLAGQKHAIAFPYGRTAQMALLKALKINGKEVICPSYTCVVVPHAIVKCGCKPVFVDVHNENYNMDWNFVEAATNENTGAVIATSIFGHPVDQTALEAYRTRHPEIFIIQDCAHSFFAAGIHQKGVAAFFGLNVSKIITSIFGGIVATNDSDLAEALRNERSSILHSVGMLKEIKRSLYLIAVLVAFNPYIYSLINQLENLGFLNKFVKYYDEAKIDLPHDAFDEMCSTEARLGEIQCGRYDEVIEHRRKLALIYRQGLKGTGDLILPPDHPGATYSHFVVRTQFANKLKAHCLANAVQLGELIDYEIPDMPVYRHEKYYGEHRSRSFPSQVINLPVHMGVSEEDAQRIVGLISEFVEQFR